MIRRGYPCSVPLRPFGHDSLKENAVRYVAQRAIFGAKRNRSVAKVFDNAPYSVHRNLVPHRMPFPCT